MPYTLDKMAMAIQHTVYQIQLMQSRTPSTENEGAVWLGNVVSINTLVALAAELALKGLHQKVSASANFERTHDLSRLFESLPSDIQNHVSNRWLKYTEDANILQRYKNLTDLFATHKRDFEKWRYLDKDVDDLRSAPLEMQFAVCAILDEVYGD